MVKTIPNERGLREEVEEKVKMDQEIEESHEDGGLLQKHLHSTRVYFKYLSL